MAEAKGLFNAAVRKLREALDYYQLDGHVTMHCNLTLEVSELYKYAFPDLWGQGPCGSTELWLNNMLSLQAPG